MAGKECIAVGGDLRFERPHEAFPEAMPLQARMDHQPTDVADAVAEVAPDRAHHLVAQARDQDVVCVVRGEQVGERLGQWLGWCRRRTGRPRSGSGGIGV